MDDNPALFLDLAGNIHTIPCDEICVIGSAQDAHIRVPNGPEYWLRIHYTGGWVGVVAYGTTELDGFTILPLGSESRVVVRFTSTEWQHLHIRYRGATLELRVRVGHGQNSTVPPIPPSSDLSSRSVDLGNRKLIIGRQGYGADIEIPGVDVGARHTVVRWTGEQAVVRDLGSGTGTYVDGQPVIWSMIAPGKSFVIGHCTFHVTSLGSLKYAPIPKSTALTVRGLTIRHWVTKKADRKRPPTLEDVSFDLDHGGFMAILGPSGVGKSTLLDGLLGDAEVVGGFARLDGVPLGGPSSPSPALVSFVPQRNATFKELTVRQTLGYCSELRLARDVSRVERDERVISTMTRLQLDAVADQPSGQLSGGQVRRLNVAMELLSEPRLLMLDEPTSGLDEGLDRRLMRDLAALAGDGCVVMIVTHSTAHLDLCDAVLAVRGPEPQFAMRRPSSGGVGFFGRASDVVDAFGADSYADVMDRLREGAAAMPPTSDPVAAPPDPPSLQSSGQRAQTSVVPWRHAFLVNLRRDVRRLGQGWQLMAELVVAGPALAALFAVIASSRSLAGSAENPNPHLGISVAVTCICLSFVAMALSLNSIVSDRAVIARERRWGVPYSAVVLSRAASRLVPACAQAAVAVLMLLVLPSLLALPPGPETPIEGFPAFTGLVVVLTGLTLASMCLGVLISTVAKNAEQAVAFMSGSLAVMVILCGLVVPLGMPEGPQAVLSWLSYLAPTRWAVSGVASYINLTIAGRSVPDQMWTQDLPHFLLPVAVLLAFCVISLTGAIWALRAGLRRGQPT